MKEEEKATETSVYVSKAKNKQTGQEREKHYRRNHNTVSGTRRNRCYFTLRKQKKKYNIHQRNKKKPEKAKCPGKSDSLIEGMRKKTYEGTRLMFHTENIIAIYNREDNCKNLLKG